MNKNCTAVLILGVFLTFSFLFIGCAPAKKPAPAPAPAPAPPSQSQRNVLPPSDTNIDTNANERANKIARALNNVPGVNRATVVLSGDTAFVGLDLEANLEKGETDRVERDCMDRVKREDSRVKTVNVASDADTVTRIKKVFQGVGDGKPISSFADELDEIGRRIMPKMKR